MNDSLQELKSIILWLNNRMITAQPPQAENQQIQCLIMRE